MFNTQQYWTSTENNANTADDCRFASACMPDFGNKTNGDFVLCVRYFP